MTQNGNRNGVTLERLQGAVTELLRAISAAVENDRELFWKSIRRAAEPLDRELRDAATGVRAAPSSTDRSLLPGGLTPSQVGRIKDFIDANLDVVIRIENLASLANLSRCHFARAFRQRFDETPHAYVMRRRIEHAQGLMLTSVAPLRQIAVDSGFADQAHFTKRFRRLVGETPSVWRRARELCMRNGAGNERLPLRGLNPTASSFAFPLFCWDTDGGENG